jgi:hypothetical protein
MKSVHVYGIQEKNNNSKVEMHILWFILLLSANGKGELHV